MSTKHFSPKIRLPGFAAGILAILLFVPLSAAAQTWPTDDEWLPFTQGGFVIADGCADQPGANNEKDLCGTPTQGTFFGDFDEDFLYFRVRVDGDPNHNGGLRPYGWVVLLDTARDRTDYEFEVVVDGIESPEIVKLYGNVTQSQPNRIADPPDDPPLASWPWVTNGRTVMADSTRLYTSCNPVQDWFIDFYIPTAPLMAHPDYPLTLTTPIYSLSGASSSASVLNADIGNENVVGDALSTGLSDPRCIDNDDDFIDNCNDNCMFIENPEQADLDGDGIGDVCDDDNDGDGVPDVTDCDPLNGNVYQGATETCDMVDEDCDGATDEGLVAPSECGTGVCYNNGYMECILGEMVDYCTDNPPTGDDTDCDGLDDDCDGTADEGFADYVSSCGVGACLANGVVTCVNNVLNDACVPGEPVGDDSDCDMVDQDCDGLYDEHYFNGSTACGVGVCASTGTSSCVLGIEDDNCFPGPSTGTDNDCDTLDDDCDGTADEAYVPLATNCGVGACARAGLTSCVTGNIQDSCVTGAPTGDDTDCDNIDDDCDESADDGYVPLATTCGVGACASTGITSCSGGNVQNSCSPGTPGIDNNCDSIDDDCDGTADDAYVGAPTSCGAGACSSVGEWICVNGGLVDSCVAGTPTSLDNDCDGNDDDCNGIADDAYIPITTYCGIGVCAATGTTTCDSGVEHDNCTVGPTTGDDTDCDALDDDCDGTADDGYVSTQTNCGLGMCAMTGTKTCVSGGQVDSCTPGPTTGDDTDCDALDDDCDGTADDGYAPVATYCGIGVCAATGTSSCNLGVVYQHCTVGPTTGDDTDCDALDDDCDGTADDGYVSTQTNCGIGVCARAGTKTCVSGGEVDSCTAGPTTGDDTDCDALDDDCDGTADDGYMPITTYCGIGVCAATGTSSCDLGVEHEHCTVGPTTGDDTDCDALDDDCDGTADDGYVPTQTNCGIGVCARAGTKTCVNGGELDSCTPGAATGDDTDCDGLDSDCDGTPDDGWLPYPTECGTGVCYSTGVMLCVGSHTTNACETGDMTGDDTDCDGLDDDCDGTADDSYAPVTTYCGVGVCADTGTSSCDLGVENENCTAGPTTGDDTDCDGLDDDCDETADDGYMPVTTYCGVGECATTGTSSCDLGVENENCTAGTASGTDTDCNGLDEDCDGTADDAYAPITTYCGVGVCAATGTSSCDLGVEHENCTGGAATGTDTDCNGLDDDCDETADDGYVPSQTNCGLGVCATTGTKTCVNGGEVDSCTPGAATGADTDCNGFDEDCDGTADDGWIPTPTTCGNGPCAAAGQMVCVNGSTQDTCVPGTPTAPDNDCDGNDDNCNGTPDDEYVPTGTVCGLGVCASTGTKTCVGGVEQDSCVLKPTTGDDTDCDALDDDCDGTADDGYAPATTNCGIGVCAATGTSSCDLGVEHQNCTAGAPTGPDTDCDGFDNDCDGIADDGYVPVTTYCGTGVCAATGTSSCDLGVEHQNCTDGGATGDDTDCDGLDDDCDGTADDGYVPVTTYCGTGECAATGTSSCDLGVEHQNCTDGGTTGDDTDCDGLDDDCDGTADDAYVPTQTECGLGVCAAVGTKTCVGGGEVDSCTPEPATGDDTDCNGFDEDCDGTPDDGYVPSGTDCGVGACAATGILTCVDGDEVDSCLPDLATGDDTDCDNVDDDCDGVADDGYVPSDTECGQGACASTGILSCENGSEVDSCEDGATTGYDTDCDGIDDDCDGTADDGYMPTDTSCGIGACLAAGLKTCVDGGEIDSCAPGATTGDDTDCDGIDDDCDGPADDGYVPVETTCGEGSCLSAGITSCTDGIEDNSCQIGSPTGDDADCDDIDDNCNGTPDDGYVATETVCGVGACATTGMKTCAGGSEIDSCTPGAATGDDTDCDGVDDDCDGADDEAYVPFETQCGVGACAETGMTDCVDGVEGNSCLAGEPAETDNTCDGVDDDCDETADDDYEPVSTNCGLGTCAASGVTTCVDGDVVDSCEPGATTGDDTDCDSVDDDCDGLADESFIRTATTCGVGSCASTGLTECVAGQLGDSCEPDDPAASDTTCNGIDDDCSGTTDEDYQPTATSCGIGACEATGVTSCVGGSLLDSCVGGEGAAEECNGADDDCDSEVDEDFPDSDDDGLADCIDPDDDDDDIIDDDDNCPLVYNPDQVDDDRNDIGNICERDYDGDGIDLDVDNCPDVFNPDQTDTDDDDIGDACDCDIDDDDVLNTNPGCVIPVGSEPDNCTMIDNPDQTDTDGNGIGDACDEVGYYSGGGCSADNGANGFGGSTWILLILLGIVIGGARAYRRRYSGV